MDRVKNDMNLKQKEIDKLKYLLDAKDKEMLKILNEQSINNNPANNPLDNSLQARNMLNSNKKLLKDNLLKDKLVIEILKNLFTIRRSLKNYEYKENNIINKNLENNNISLIINTPSISYIGKDILSMLNYKTEIIIDFKLYTIFSNKKF